MANDEPFRHEYWKWKIVEKSGGVPYADRWEVPQEVAEYANYLNYLWSKEYRAGIRSWSDNASFKVTDICLEAVKYSPEEIKALMVLDELEGRMEKARKGLGYRY